MYSFEIILTTRDILTRIFVDENKSRDDSSFGQICLPFIFWCRVTGLWANIAIVFGNARQPEHYLRVDRTGKRKHRRLARVRRRETDRGNTFPTAVRAGRAPGSAPVRFTEYNMDSGSKRIPRPTSCLRRAEGKYSRLARGRSDLKHIKSTLSSQICDVYHTGSHNDTTRVGRRWWTVVVFSCTLWNLNVLIKKCVITKHVDSASLNR